MNLGLGYSDDVTYASIFPNTPTTDSLLEFNVAYEGDVSQDCSWDASSKTYVSSSGTSSSGCTVSIPSGGSATLVLSS
jgi:SUN family beta-glucosidase